MRPNSDDFQSTPLSPSPDAPPRPAPQAAVPAPAAAATTAEPSRIGIVLVHGIGSQAPAEFFLEGSEPLVRLLGAWSSSVGGRSDPVTRSEFSFSGASRPYLEIAIPPIAGDPGWPAATWIVTEAWWATDLRAPSLGEASRYLRSRIGTIVTGITEGFSREERWAKRASRASEAAGSDWRQSELEQRRWDWIPAFDRLQMRFTRYSLLATVVPAFIGLAVWAPLRALPFGPLRSFAEARLVDTFLTDWFGDLPVLLDDPVQSANIRARLAGTIAGLRQLGCDAVVLVAHSGGAILSFEMLIDPAYASDPVDKLVTLGEALDLGWRLEGAYREPLPNGNRLRGDPRTFRPNLRWADFWASYDPAPAGRVDPPDGIPIVARDPHVYPGDPPLPSDKLVIEDRPVTNYMSLFNDHGGYWDNDEGFLVGLVRQLDRPRDDVETSRFYRDPVDRAVRIQRRRTRVATLAAWRWLVGLALLVTVLVAGARPFDGPLWNGGASLEALWAIVPGHEIVSGIFEAIGTFVGLLAGLVLGGSDGARVAAVIGVLLFGGVLVALLFTALFAIGLVGWRAWDVAERTLARSERLRPASRRGAAACMVAMLGGLALLAFCTVRALDPLAVPAAAGWWLLTAVAGAAILATSGQDPDASDADRLAVLPEDAS